MITTDKNLKLLLYFRCNLHVFDKVFMKSKKFINGKSKAYLFSDLSMIDIDEPFHLEVAKSLFKNNKNFNKFKTKCRRLN